MIMAWDCFSQALVDYGAKVNDEDDSGMTPLLSLMTWLDWYGGLEMGGERHIKQLVSQGANINHTDHAGWTALHFAAKGLRVFPACCSPAGFTGGRSACANQ